MESYVQGVIRINILRFLHFSHHRAKLRNVSQTDTACGKPACQAEQMSAHVINLRGLGHTHFPNEHTTIRNNPHQVALFKASARFAYRSSTNAQHLGERAFVNSISRLQFSPDDHSLEFFGDQGTEGFCAPASSVYEQVLVFHLADLLQHNRTYIVV